MPLPPAGRRPPRRGEGEQLGQISALRLHRVRPGGLRQLPQIRRHLDRRLEPRSRAPYTDLTEPAVRLLGGHPGREPSRVPGQRLHRQRPGQRELQEHRVQPLLVDRQAVLPLGVAGPQEHLARESRVLHLAEDPPGPLEEGRQEVRYGVGQPPRDLLVGGQRHLRFGLRLPGDLVQLGHEPECLTAVPGWCTSTHSGKASDCRGPSPTSAGSPSGSRPRKPAARSSAAPSSPATSRTTTRSSSPGCR